jgi:hypothetical protein
MAKWSISEIYILFLSCLWVWLNCSTWNISEHANQLMDGGSGLRHSWSLHETNSPF